MHPIVIITYQLKTICYTVPTNGANGILRFEK